MAYTTPLGSSAPDGPNAFETLAGEVQADVDALQAAIDAIEAGNARRAYAEAAGFGTISFAAGTNYDDTTIALPSGRFTVAPSIVVSITNADGGSQKLHLRATNATTTSAIVRAYTGDFPSAVPNAVSVSFTWHAVQMQATQATG